MIAERLTALRLAAGASQDKVAQDLHMTRSSYSSYETGRRMPPVEALAPLAQYYNTTTDYILGISDERNPIPQLDERGRALIRLYQEADGRGRDTIYRIALQEKIQYGSSEKRSDTP